MTTFQEENGYAIEPNYLASLKENVRKTIYSDCRQRNMSGLKFKSNDDSDFPTSYKELVDLDFNKLDIIIRLSMRPSNKAEFLMQLKKNVSFWLPDNFKSGILNFKTQYKSYQQCSEELRKLYVWMSFSGEPEFDKSLLPDVDGKEQSLIKTFREMLPIELSQYFFTVLPKPAGYRWTNFLQFLDAMDVTWHQNFSNFRQYVLPFANIYHGHASDRGGTLKTISGFMDDSEDPLDGDPVVISEEELERLQEDSAKLSSLEGDLCALFAFAGDAPKKTENLPCFKTLFSKTGLCPDRSTCKFSHDPVLLKQKHKDLSSELKQSRFASLEDHGEA